jgi:acetyltransferase
MGQRIHAEALFAGQAQGLMSELIGLIQDAVNSGASVGFLPPLESRDAREYWLEAIAAVESGTRILIGAFVDAELAGTVQLSLAMKPNALHRAEVMKLMVHQRVRRQGIGRILMTEAENAAKAAGRTLLVLDTREGDGPEKLYRSIGYQLAGVIPGYARSASGELHSTIFFYKELGRTD